MFRRSSKIINRYNRLLLCKNNRKDASEYKNKNPLPFKVKRINNVKRTHPLPQLPLEIIKMIVWGIAVSPSSKSSWWFHVTYVLLGRQILFINIEELFDLFTLKLTTTVLLPDNVKSKLHEYILPSGSSGIITHHRSNNKPAIVQYYENGSIIEERYFHKGKLHRENDAAIVRYHENGIISEKRYYIKGKECFQNNNLISMMYFEDGNPSQEIYRYENYYYQGCSRIIEIRYNSNIGKGLYKSDSKNVVCYERYDSTSCYLSRNYKMKWRILNNYNFIEQYSKHLGNKTVPIDTSIENICIMVNEWQTSSIVPKSTSLKKLLIEAVEENPKIASKIDNYFYRRILSGVYDISDT